MQTAMDVATEDEEKTTASVRVASETRLRDCSLLIKAMPPESLYKSRLQTNQSLLEQNKAMLAQLEQVLTAREENGDVPALVQEQRKDVAKKILLVKANLSEILRIYTQELPGDEKSSSSSSSSATGGGGAAISPR